MTAIASRQARLSRKITMANELAVYVFGLLARDEYQLASRRDDDLGVHFRSRQILGPAGSSTSGLISPPSDLPGPSLPTRDMLRARRSSTRQASSMGSGDI